MKYEYDVVTLELTEEQQQVIQMGLGDIEQINAMICDIINKRAADGWEPLYPFSVPQVWFRKEIKARRRKKITKKTRQSAKK